MDIDLTTGSESLETTPPIATATRQQFSGRTCTQLQETDRATPYTDSQLNQPNDVTRTHDNRSIAYNICLSSNALSTGPISTALPARVRARLKPIQPNDEADTAATIHKLVEKQQRAATRREVVLQEKRKQARLPITQLYALAALRRQSLGQNQKKAHLPREAKLDEKVMKACKADCLSPDRGSVAYITEKQRQAENRRQALEDVKLKKARDSERSHWYAPDTQEVTTTRQQLLDKQARADNRCRHYLQARLQNVK